MLNIKKIAGLGERVTLTMFRINTVKYHMRCEYRIEYNKITVHKKRQRALDMEHDKVAI